MSLVVDASVTLAWIMEDEATEHAVAVFDRVAQAGAIVPGHWRLEVANALLMAERRGRASRQDRLDSLRDLAVLPIEADAETWGRAWSDTSFLAETHKLTTYDAAYLELALRRGLPLATLDAELRAAATAAGVGRL